MPSGRMPRSIETCRYVGPVDPLADAQLVAPTGPGYDAVATTYNALMTGLVLSLVSRQGEDVAAEFVQAHFRRQHLEKFLPGLRKLGLDTEPDAVACALYHFHSNALGGVKTEYWRESDKKAWVRYPPPRWIWRGTAACGIPHRVNIAMLHGWHGHNGVSLGNPRLGFVCTATLTQGQSGLEGYYVDEGRDLEPHERVRFVTDERMPRVDPASMPVLDTASWPEERRRKTLRSYAMEYVRSMVPTLNAMLGLEAATAELGRVARLIGLQFHEELAATVGPVSHTTAASFGQWLAVMLASHGEKVELDISAAGAARVMLRSWRLFDGVALSAEERVAAFSSWNELWVGAALSHDRFLHVDVAYDGTDARWDVSLR